MSVVSINVFGRQLYKRSLVRLLGPREQVHFVACPANLWQSFFAFSPFLAFKKEKRKARAEGICHAKL
jgi:hypothetical protein